MEGSIVASSNITVHNSPHQIYTVFSDSTGKEFQQMSIISGHFLQFALTIKRLFCAFVELLFKTIFFFTIPENYSEHAVRLTPHAFVC